MIRLRRLILPAAALAAILGFALPAAASSGPAPTVSHGPSPVIPGVVTPSVSGGHFVCVLHSPSDLCATNNGTLGSLIAADNIDLTGGETRNAEQGWVWVQSGVTSSTSPFTVGSGLNTQVAAGRPVGRFQATFGAQGCITTAGSSGAPHLQGCSTSGPLWVQTGSGRLVNVQSSDNNGFLLFLGATGGDGSNPSQTGGAHNCPQYCWSDTLGGPGV